MFDLSREIFNLFYENPHLLTLPALTAALDLKRARAGDYGLLAVRFLMARDRAEVRLKQQAEFDEMARYAGMHENDFQEGT